MAYLEYTNPHRYYQRWGFFYGSSVAVLLNMTAISLYNTAIELVCPYNQTRFNGLIIEIIGNSCKRSCPRNCIRGVSHLSFY
jgi:hypothetical protein